MIRVFVILLVCSIVAVEDDPGPEVRRLVADFRNAADTPEHRPALLGRILAEGPDAVRLLGTAIEDELRDLLDEYRREMTRRAKPALRALRPRRREVESLREQVLTLARSPSLTADQIIRESDPAMERLRAMLFVTPEALLGSSPELRGLGRRIDALTLYWRQCVEFEEAAAVPGEHPRPRGRVPRDPGVEEIVRRHEILAVALAMPMSGSERRTLTENDRDAWEIGTGEALGILDLNVMRILLGLRPVRVDVKLCAAARDHSNDMRTRGFFSHESPVPGKKTPSRRASLFGASASAENIARGQRSPIDTNRGWFHSPGHHRNMLSNHSRIGLGRSELFWTQMFG
jgi:hypothetical protein